MGKTHQLDEFIPASRRSTPRSRTVTHFGPGEPVAAARHLALFETRDGWKTRAFFGPPKRWCLVREVGPRLFHENLG